MLTSPKIITALDDLSVQIGKSKNLSKRLPIRVMTTGGFVSVSCLHNRHVTGDLDYILDPKLSKKLMKKLEVANFKISRNTKIDEHWFNSGLSAFVLCKWKEQLFKDSVEQDLVLWQSENLVVYACKWEWALDRKLKRYKAELRNVDMWDALFILDRIISNRDGELVGREEIRSWYPNMLEPIPDSVFDVMAVRFRNQFGRDGLIA